MNEKEEINAYLCVLCSVCSGVSGGHFSMLTDILSFDAEPASVVVTSLSA